MGGWRLESAKMLGYLMFPISAFVCFNHPTFYQQALGKTMEIMSNDINLESLAKFQQFSAKGEIDKLSGLIEELDNAKKATKG